MNAGAPDHGPAWPSARICLDGAWDLIPGDHTVTALGSAQAVPVQVPGLWEAQGHLSLDGTAWYRREVTVPDPAGWWTLHFGAVMDEAEVYLNRGPAGRHRSAFTPFEVEWPHPAAGVNEIAVRVTDHPAGAAEHRRSAHGKQGWANHVFASPPSLYLTYGGIWQSVWLEQHGPARISDCWVNSDPADLRFDVTAAGPAGDLTAEIEVLGQRAVLPVPADGGPARFRFGPVSAALWSPESPALHQADVRLYAGDRLSHTRRIRFGLRTIGLSRSSFELNGVPVKMRSALVQGFSATALYGAESRAEAEAQVRAAKEAGLNTLRLHIKAFDPVYLDVCDELGMLVHCDIPVAEPIAHDELGADGPVAERCAAAATEQVRRDRSHPSIVLWSAMNEIGIEEPATRPGRRYEGFARRLYEAVHTTDPTRPVIENDWIEPDPGRVFASPLLTAHWYGRLSGRYLAELRDKVTRGAATARPLLISEFGDWGLPGLSEQDGEKFWSYGPGLSALIASTPWPRSVPEFVQSTQRYQGLADRFQIEIFRQAPGVVGWCVTELTDVPHEFNGLFDLLGTPKQPAIEEIRRATQTVCPILVRQHWAATAGGTFGGELVIVNDGPAISDAELLVELGTACQREQVRLLPAQTVTRVSAVTLPSPPQPGPATLSLILRRGNDLVAGNAYPVLVAGGGAGAGVRVTALDKAVRGLLTPAGADFIDLAGARPGPDVLVIGEGALDAEAAVLAAGWLRDAGHVLLLAQDKPVPDPLPVRLTSLDTAWGSTPFVFTTSEPALASLPRGAVLASELLSTAPEHIYTDLAGNPFAAQTAVALLKPPPDQLLGTVIGKLPVAAGQLTVCQFPLTEPARGGDPLAASLLGDLLGWARPSS